MEIRVWWKGQGIEGEKGIVNRANQLSILREIFKGPTSTFFTDKHLTAKINP